FDLSSAIMLAIGIVLDKEFTDERMIRSPGHSFFSIGCGAAGRDPRQSRRHPTRVAEGHTLRPRSSCHFPNGTKRKKKGGSSSSRSPSFPEAGGGRLSPPVASSAMTRSA